MWFGMNFEGYALHQGVPKSLGKPVVLVPETKLIKFCVSKFDANYTDKLLDWLGAAHFQSAMDLTKGYWHVPLTPTSLKIQ